jgi:UPF0755 protein
VTQRERESAAAVGQDHDPHAFLFGDDYEEESDGLWETEPARLTRADRRRAERAQRAHRRRLSRRGWFFVLIIGLIVAALAAFAVPKIVDAFSSDTVADYSGSGTGRTVVTVSQGDAASDIGTALFNAHVVKSVAAFTDAAAANPKSTQIQPGRYALPMHISGADALQALLDPTSRVESSNLVVPEGATTLDVEASMLECYGDGAKSEIESAMQSRSLVDASTTYKVGSSYPSSPEGFLYPATYTCDPKVTPLKALSSMVYRFLKEDRDLQFASAAKKVHLSPYDALIVASIAQSEAKFAQDMPKVARVILNRIGKNRALQFDSTSAYACKIQGIPPAKCVYDKVEGPYNTYLHTGLPPTPIGNPGADAMHAAVNPKAGGWMYFVTVDPAGHLGFFTDEKDWEKAVQKCQRNHWGCG